MKCPTPVGRTKFRPLTCCVISLAQFILHVQRNIINMTSTEFPVKVLCIKKFINNALSDVTNDALYDVTSDVLYDITNDASYDVISYALYDVTYNALYDVTNDA